MKPSFKTSNPRLDIGPTEIPHTGSFRFCTITFPFVLSVSMMRYVKVYSILLIVVHSVFNTLHALLMDKLLHPIWLSRSSSLLRNEIVTLYFYTRYKLHSSHLARSAIITQYRQGNKFYTVKRCNYTRGGFGGRQPVCGTGVTSLI